jgi:hypothetical protein
MIKRRSGLSTKGLSHLKSWQKSGLSLSEYSRRSGVSVSTLCTWKKKYGESEEEGRFISLNETASAEVEYPGGIKVKVQSDTNIEVLKLLKAAYGV